MLKGDENVTPYRKMFEFKTVFLVHKRCTQKQPKTEKKCTDEKLNYNKLKNSFDLEHSRCENYFDRMYRTIQFTFVALIAIAVFTFSNDLSNWSIALMLSFVLPAVIYVFGIMFSYNAYALAIYGKRASVILQSMFCFDTIYKQTKDKQTEDKQTEDKKAEDKKAERSPSRILCKPQKWCKIK